MSEEECNGLSAIDRSMNRILKELEEFQIPTSGSSVAIINRLYRIRERVADNISFHVELTKRRLNIEKDRVKTRAAEKTLEDAEKEKLEEEKKQLEKQKVRDDKEREVLRDIVDHLKSRWDFSSTHIIFIELFRIRNKDLFGQKTQEKLSTS